MYQQDMEKLNSHHCQKETKNNQSYRHLKRIIDLNMKFNLLDQNSNRFHHNHQTCFVSQIV